MRRLDYCTYIRIIAMVIIILCHLVVHHPNPYVQMTVEVINFGVIIFFCLSGFLFGIQGQIDSIGKWYRKRLKRIYIPWLLFIVVLAGIHLLKGYDILTWNWAKLVLGIQGANVGVQGAGHTWFITCLLICYLVTPLFNTCFSKVNPRITCIILAFAPMALVVLPRHIFTLLYPVCWFGVAYYAGRMYDESWLTWRNGLIAMIAVIGSMFVRFAVRLIAENSFWYEKLCVSYTQFAAAAGSMLFLAVLLKNSKVRPVSKYLSDISFEVYLYHYMLCVGPISIFATGLPWMWSSLLIVVCSIGIASAAHYITEYCLTRKFACKQT